MPLDAHEEAMIRTFLDFRKRDRYITLLGNPKRRAQALDDLNHRVEFDPRCVVQMPGSTDVNGILRAVGAPDTCHVISDDPVLDGRDMPLVDALSEAEISGSGTLIGCIPGRLAYYYGEQGERRILLKKP